MKGGGHSIATHLAPFVKAVVEERGPLILACGGFGADFTESSLLARPPKWLALFVSIWKVWQLCEFLE